MPPSAPLGSPWAGVPVGVQAGGARLWAGWVGRTLPCLETPSAGCLGGRALSSWASAPRPQLPSEQAWRSQQLGVLRMRAGPEEGAAVSLRLQPWRWGGRWWARVPSLEASWLPALRSLPSPTRGVGGSLG